MEIYRIIKLIFKNLATIKQFLEDVVWGELDYLIIDTPPGTSDEHISICEYLMNYQPDGAVLVTTPQLVSLTDVRKEISFCKKLQIPILGLVENMSGFACPHCDCSYNIFSSGGGESLANQTSIPFIGKIPINPLFNQVPENSTIVNSLQTFPAIQNFVSNFITNKEIPQSQKTE